LTDEKKTMKEYGLAHGDVVILQRVKKRPQQPQQPQAAAPGLQ
jgi:hypothetical protein